MSTTVNEDVNHTVAVVFHEHGNIVENYRSFGGRGLFVFVCSKASDKPTKC
jgi:hypothetical protein